MREIAIVSPTHRIKRLISRITVLYLYVVCIAVIQTWIIRTVTLSKFYISLKKKAPETIPRCLNFHLISACSLLSLRFICHF